jgi:AraC-like DNA-binding protein/quercetin dioxygenase-like cupin family protein
MKPFIEKPISDEVSSFVVRTFSTPLLEVPWHQHVECELILFTKGEGICFIGNQAEEFQAGDVFFLGANLPHTFQNPSRSVIASAIVIQFKEDFWGETFMALPECTRLRQLFKIAVHGLKLSGKLKVKAHHTIRQLDRSRGLQRIALLCDCLDAIACSTDYAVLSTQAPVIYNNKNQERIDAIFRYTIDHFQEEIKLETIASHLGMSVTTFCNYFKKSTKKTYINFLNEIKIGFACRQLIETNKTIQQICYESGYNTVANFNKQFFKVKNASPSSWKKGISRKLLDAIN